AIRTADRVDRHAQQVPALQHLAIEIVVSCPSRSDPRTAGPFVGASLGRAPAKETHAGTRNSLAEEGRLDVELAEVWNCRTAMQARTPILCAWSGRSKTDANASVPLRAHLAGSPSPPRTVDFLPPVPAPPGLLDQTKVTLGFAR